MGISAHFDARVHYELLVKGNHRAASKADFLFRSLYSNFLVMQPQQRENHIECHLTTAAVFITLTFHFPALMRVLIWALKTSLAHRVKYDIPQRLPQIHLSRAFTAVISGGNELFKSVEPSTHQHRRPQQSEGQN